MREYVVTSVKATGGTRSDKECSISRERGGYDHAGRCSGGIVCVWAVEWTINEEGREEED